MRRRLIKVFLIATGIVLAIYAFVIVTHLSHLRERALVLAAWRGDAGEVHRLLEAGVNPNAIVRPDIDSDLNWWAHELLDPRDRMVFRMPALEAAGFGNHSDIIRDLLAHGANPNFRAGDGGTALLLAAHNGDVSLVRELLKRGADPKLGWKDGTTPRQETLNKEIESLLIAAGG